MADVGHPPPARHVPGKRKGKQERKVKGPTQAKRWLEWATRALKVSKFQSFKVSEFQG
jgi:hypothetical protein